MKRSLRYERYNHFNALFCNRSPIIVILLAGLMVAALGCVPRNIPVIDRYNLADQFYHQKKYKRAARLYTTFLLQNPQHPLADRAIFHLGRISLHQKEYQRAFFQFEKIILNYPHSVYFLEAKLGIALCYFYFQNYAESIPLFQEYLRYDHAGQEDETIIFLADAYFALKEYRKALDEYTSFLQMFDPQNKQTPKILYKISLCWIHLEKYDLAIANLHHLLNTKYGVTHRSEIHQSLAKANLMRKLPLEALDELLKARQYAEDPELLRQYEQEIVAVIQNQISQEELQTLIGRYNKNYPADLALIELGYKLQKGSQLLKARQVWEEFLTTFPNHPGKETVLGALEKLDLRLTINKTKIGCIVPISGDLSVYGNKVVKGIKLALEEYNLRTNSDIRLFIVDSKGNPDYGKNGLELLAEKEQIMVFIGPLLSSVAYALAPVADELGVSIITPTATGESIPESSPYFFRNCLTNQQQGRALAEYAINVLNLERIGILYPYNPYGIELMKIVAQEIEKLGGEISIIEFYEEGDTDFRYQLERINWIRPEGLFIPGYPEEVVLIAPQVPFYVLEEEELVAGVKEGEDAQRDPNISTGMLQENILADANTYIQIQSPSEKGEEKYDIQLLGCDGWYSEQVITYGGKYIEGVVFTSGFFKEDMEPHVREFVTNYKKNYGCLPDLLSAQAYDATNIILEALMKSDNVNREELRKSIYNTRDFYGVTGVTHFSSSGEAIKEIPILTIKNHRFIRLN